MMRTGACQRLREAGFSLAEVAIALGIVAFALTAIVGLLSVTLKTSRSAMDDLMISEMTSDIVTTLRRQSFTDIDKNPTVFFDGSGRRLNGIDLSTGVISNLSTNDAVQRGAVYACSLRGPNDSDRPTSDPSFEAVGSTNLWRINLLFQWPAGAASSPNRKVIHADIARY